MDGSCASDRSSAVLPLFHSLELAEVGVGRVALLVRLLYIFVRERKGILGLSAMGCGDLREKREI